MWKCEKCGLSLPINAKGPIYCVCGFVPDMESKIDIQEPSFLQKAVNFAGAITQHVFSGFQQCTQEQIDYRLALCKACELFIKKDESVGVCGHEKCGCNLKNEQVFLNKLAWADQQCPLGKWTKISPGGENGV